MEIFRYFSMLAFSTFIFSFPAFAQNIVAIEKGELAPFDGVLMNKETAADIIASGELSDERCTIRLEYEIGKATNACNLDKGIAEANLAAEKERSEKILFIKTQEIDRLSKKLEESSTTDWGPAWFAGGASIGVAASLIIFFIAVQTVTVDITQL
tara:strand:- start:13637 stop:14101 length:465 start_codon:yes stop_codon:yes gene_type:complete